MTIILKSFVLDVGMEEGGKYNYIFWISDLQ